MCAAVLGAAAVLVALLLGLLHARRQRSSGRSLWGKLLPPGLRPGTTLLVTDIQVLRIPPRHCWQPCSVAGQHARPAAMQRVECGADTALFSIH
jgi:hypothetical protein